MNEFQYSLRTIAKSPVFTLSVAALLAIGIGAASVAYSAFDAIFLRPLPVRDPEQLIRIVETIPGVGTRSNHPYAFLAELRDHSTSFVGVFGEAQIQAVVGGQGPTEVIQVGLVTPEFFEVLGVSASQGRALGSVDESEVSSELVAVLSHSFWLRFFAENPDVIGQTITLRGHPFVVVGVMPQGFNGTTVDTAPEVRVPLRAHAVLSSTELPMENDVYFDVGGRLRQDTTLDEATAEARTIWRRSVEAFYREVWQLPVETVSAMMRIEPEVVSLERGVSVLRDRYGIALTLLLALAGLLLVLVCSNVAGLLLVRSAQRRHEITIRLAVGATRMRLVRQMLAESIVFAAIGVAGGLALTAVAVPMLRNALPPLRNPVMTPLTLNLEVGIDWRVVLFSIAISIGTVLLFGLAPAVAGSRTSLETALRKGRTKHGPPSRSIPVVVQVAVCTVLLSTAGLLARSVQELSVTETGLDQDYIVTFTVHPGLVGYTAEESEALRENWIRRVSGLPGVESAAASLMGVMRGSGLKTTVAPAGEGLVGAELDVSVNNVSEGYFGTIGMGLLRGRDFTETDDWSDSPVSVVVNETFADRFFSGRDPIGQAFGVPRNGVGQAGYQIIGVVSDAKYRSLREPIQSTYYVPLREGGFGQLVMRTTSRPEPLIGPALQVLRDLDPSLPISEVHTLSEEVHTSFAPERLTASLASSIASVAALLAAVGIYGLLALVVAERQHEMGIRLALGAAPRKVGQLVIRQGLKLVSIGCALGLLIAIGVGRFLEGLLFGVEPVDPTTFIAIIALLFLIACISSYFPAQRATKIDPMTSLRHE